jgi:hypothetical protein
MVDTVISVGRTNHRSLLAEGKALWLGTQGSVAGANYLIAAFCRVTHDRPAGACGNGTTGGLKRQLPRA